MSMAEQRCSSSVFIAILFIIAIIDYYMFSHVRITKLCVYTFKLCVHQGCGELVTRANLVEHLEKSCQFRMEKCDYCQTLVEFAFLKVTIKLMKLFFIP